MLHDTEKRKKMTTQDKILMQRLENKPMCKD